MRSVPRAGFLLWLWALPVAAADTPTTPPSTPPADRAGLAYFEEHVRPLFVEHCYKCHATSAKSVRGGLLLDSKAGWTKGGDSGPALVPGQPEKSLLLKTVSYTDKIKMPPKGKLSDKQIAVLTQWIKLGAPDPRVGAVVAAKPIDLEKGRAHWAFQSLKTVPEPALSEPTDWVKTPIDRFIWAKLQSSGLKPNPSASKALLIRRAYFDLLGLPPTAAEVAAFVQDPDPKAYEKLLDKLLESPHYGERWARHWLDVARFAESHGYEQDYNRPFAYHYRDYLIQAFNRDQPWDEMIRWQVAGDELAPDQPQALLATGFLGAGAFPTQLTETEFESARYDELDDMSATTGLAFLGLSVGCARCHDHKFDPVAAHDYYRFAANFTTTIRSEIDLALKPGEKPTKVQVTSEGYPHTKHHADDRGFPHFYPQTHLLHRGDVQQKKEVVSAGYLRVLMRNGKEEAHWQVAPPADWKRTSFRRAGLANWLTDAEHGAGALAARVVVNRLWLHHFGRGLVGSPNDFGTQGEAPSHPELLEWLADDLVKHGWKLKRLHKLLMTSAVYMQSSQSDEGRAQRDKENRYYWRRTPRRLEAEAIRDAMLSVAGLLEPQMYGPGTLDANMKRRSVYFLIKRSQLVPMLMLFDWPEHLVSIGQRSVTTIAPQALHFMNSPQGRSFAEGFAKRLPTQDPVRALEESYQSAYGRLPSEAERSLAKAFLTKQQSTYQSQGKKNADQLAWADWCQVLLSANEFVYIE